MVHKNRHFIAGSSLLTLMLVSTALAAEKLPLADVEMKALLGKGLQVRSTDLQAGKLFTAQMIYAPNGTLSGTLTFTGRPPTAFQERTGLFTPPGITWHACS